MRVVACCTVSNHSLSSPIGYTFPMGPPNPISLLPEVAFSAQLITMVKIYFSALFILEKITLIVMVTITTGQLITLFAVIDNDIAMGEFGCIFDFHKGIVMAFAALISLNKWLACKDFEAATLVLNFGSNTFLCNGENRLYLHVIIGFCCVLYVFKNQALRGPGSSSKKYHGEKQEGA